MARIIVGSVLALWVGTAYGEGRALGLDLPKEALSLWKIGENSAWGLEANAWWSRNEEESVERYRRGGEDGERVSYLREDRRHAQTASLSLIYQRSGGSLHNVRPLIFSGIGGGFSSFDPPEKGGMDRQAWLKGLVGLGAEWKPFERVGLWVRRELSFRYEASTSEDPFDGRDLDHSYRRVGLGRPEVSAFFVF